MLQEESLSETEPGQFEEPIGDVIDVIDRTRNSLVVITEIKSEKGGDTGGESVAEQTEPPIDPESFSVAELESELDDMNISDDERRALLEAEQSGKDRKTAVSTIKNK